MIALHPSAESLLRRIIAAGDAGLTVGRESHGDVLALTLDQLVTLRQPLMVATATDKGRAFAHRVTA